MAYDVTIVNVRPGTMPKALPKLQEALKSGPGKLLACWTTDVGMLNQIMIIRSFASPGEAAQAREAATMGDNPLGVAEFATQAASDTFAPLPFLPELKEGTYGPFFEARTYLMKGGVSGGNRDRWEKALPERTKRSPLLVAMNSVSGVMPRFIHIWPYKSMDERYSVRTTAMKDGIWPPPGGGEATLLLQQNDIYVPTAFSPIK